MKSSFILLLVTLVFAIGCSSTPSRDPSSVKQEKDSAHEKFQGLFDKQY